MTNIKKKYITQYIIKYVIDAKQVYQLLTSGIDLICLSDDIIVQNGINTIPTLVAKLDKLHKRRKFE